MASNAFQKKGTSVPSADAKNFSGQNAYKLSSKAALAQLAVTGCFNQTFYTSGEDQLQQVLALAKEVEPEFVAKVAVYARKSGMMKDMPAALTVFLTTVDAVAARKAFPKVIDNGKMLRNFIQILRSGAFGRHNASSATMKRLIGEWFNSRTDDTIFNMSLGSNPSFGDIIKMSRVRPKTKERSALQAWLIGKETAKFGEESFLTASALPARVAAYEAYKTNPTGDLPAAPFEMLTGLTLDEAGWKEVARRASWGQTFRNINTFSRHGVFTDPAMVKLVADKIRDEKLIKAASAFPYQLLMAYKATVEGQTRSYGLYTQQATERAPTPPEIAEALQDALEIAVDNVPAFEGNVVLCPDVSGSMQSNITGQRRNAKTGKIEQHTTMVRCIDVAGLLMAAMLRRNRSARVIPFEGKAITTFRPNPRDSVMTNANALARLGGGATECSEPLRVLNREKADVDLVVFVSDYESNGQIAGSAYHRGSSMMAEWITIQRRCPNARLVCIDVAPHGTVQAPDQTGRILNVGGFSDAVFDVVAAFTKGSTKDHWVDVIEKVEL